MKAIIDGVWNASPEAVMKTANDMILAYVVSSMIILAIMGAIMYHFWKKF